MTPEALFDRDASWYDAAHDSHSVDGHALRARLETVIRRVGSGPGDLLDAGMGPGRLLERLASRDWTVSGVDLSERMIEHARRRLPQHANRLFQAPVEALPFADSTFDIVVATGVLEYVSDPTLAVGELVRVLRPAGRLIASLPNRRSLHVLSKRAYYPLVRAAKRALATERPAPPRQNGLTPDALERLLRHNGLDAIAFERTSFAIVPTPLDLIASRTAARAADALERGHRFGRLLATQLVVEARRR